MMRQYLTSQSALVDLGNRIKSFRIYSLMTQEDLALKSGVSRRSIQNMENGEDVNFSTMIKVLMALGLDSNLDLLVPDPTQRPSNFINYNNKPRLRATKKKTQVMNKEFNWGDETK